MKELIQLRVNLLKASRFIRVHNAPMDADQIIENSLQIVNSLIERASAEPSNQQSNCNDFILKCPSCNGVDIITLRVYKCIECGHQWA